MLYKERCHAMSIVKFHWEYSAYNAFACHNNLMKHAPRNVKITLGNLRSGWDVTGPGSQK